jgi:hypothetical protein
VAAGDRELDLAAALGAEREASTQIFSLYIPNKDRHGRVVETGSGQLRRERTVIVYTYIKPDRFLAHVAALREFLHRFGRETNQEAVVAELSGAEGLWFFRIKEYDE